MASGHRWWWSAGYSPWRWTASSPKHHPVAKESFEPNLNHITFHVKFPRFFFFFVLVMSKTKSLLLIILGTEAPSPPRQGLLEVKQPTNPVDKKKNHHREVPLRCRGSTTQSGSFFCWKPGRFLSKAKMRKRKGFGVLWSRCLWGWYAMLTASHAAKGSRLVRVYVFTGWAFTARSI